MSIIKEKLSFIIVGVLLPKFHSFETDLDSLLM